MRGDDAAGNHVFPHGESCGEAALLAKELQAAKEEAAAVKGQLARAVAAIAEKDRELGETRRLESAALASLKASLHEKLDRKTAEALAFSGRADDLHRAVQESDERARILEQRLSEAEEAKEQALQHSRECDLRLRTAAKTEAAARERALRHQQSAESLSLQLLEQRDAHRRALEAATAAAAQNRNQDISSAQYEWAIQQRELARALTRIEHALHGDLPQVQQHHRSLSHTPSQPPSPAPHAQGLPPLQPGALVSWGHPELAVITVGVSNAAGLRRSQRGDLLDTLLVTTRTAGLEPVDLPQAARVVQKDASAAPAACEGGDDHTLLLVPYGGLKLGEISRVSGNTWAVRCGVKESRGAGRVGIRLLLASGEVVGSRTLSCVGEKDIRRGDKGGDKGGEPGPANDSFGSRATFFGDSGKRSLSSAANWDRASSRSSPLPFHPEHSASGSLPPDRAGGRSWSEPALPHPPVFADVHFSPDPAPPGALVTGVVSFRTKTGALLSHRGPAASPFHLPAASESSAPAVNYHIASCTVSEATGVLPLSMSAVALHAKQACARVQFTALAEAQECRVSFEVLAHVKWDSSAASDAGADDKTSLLTYETTSELSTVVAQRVTGSVAVRPTSTTSLLGTLSLRLRELGTGIVACRKADSDALHATGQLLAEKELECRDLEDKLSEVLRETDEKCRDLEDKLSDVLRETDEKVSDAERQLASTRSTAQSLTDQLRELVERDASETLKHRALSADHAAQTAELRGKIESLQTENASLHAQATQLHRQLSEARDRDAKAASQLRAVSAQDAGILSAKEDECDSLSRKVRALQSELEANRRTLHQANAELATQRAAVENPAEITRLKADLTELRAELDRKDREIARKDAEANRKVRSVQSDVASTSSLITHRSAHENPSRASAEIDDLRAEVDRKDGEIAEVNRKFRSLQFELANASRNHATDIDDLRAEVDRKDREIARKDAENRQFRSVQSDPANTSLITHRSAHENPSRASAEIAELRAEVDRKDDEIAEVNRKVRSLQSELANASLSHATEIDDLRAEVDRKDGEIAEANRKSRSLQAELASASRSHATEIDDLRAEVDRKDREIVRKDAENRQVRSVQSDPANISLITHRSAHENPLRASAEIVELRAEVDRKDDEIAEVNRKFRSLQSELANASRSHATEIDDLRAEVDRKDGEIAEVNRKFRSLQAELATASRGHVTEIDDLRAEVDRKDGEIVEVNRKFRSLQTELASASRSHATEIDDLRAEAARKDREIARSVAEAREEAAALRRQHRAATDELETVQREMEAKVAELLSELDKREAAHQRAARGGRATHRTDQSPGTARVLEGEIVELLRALAAADEAACRQLLSTQVEHWCAHSHSPPSMVAERGETRVQHPADDTRIKEKGHKAVSFGAVAPHRSSGVNRAAWVRFEAAIADAEGDTERTRASCRALETSTAEAWRTREAEFCEEITALRSRASAFEQDAAARLQAAEQRLRELAQRSAREAEAKDDDLAHLERSLEACQQRAKAQLEESNRGGRALEKRCASGAESWREQKAELLGEIAAAQTRLDAAEGPPQREASENSLRQQVAALESKLEASQLNAKERLEEANRRHRLSHDANANNEELWRTQEAGFRRKIESLEGKLRQLQQDAAEQQNDTRRQQEAMEEQLQEADRSYRLSHEANSNNVEVWRVQEAGFQSKIKSLEKSLQQAQQQAAERRTEAQRESDTIETRQTASHQEVQDAPSHTDPLHHPATDAQRSAAQSARRTDRLEDELASCENQLANAEASCAELERRCASLEKVADQLRQRLAEAEANTENLTAEPTLSKAESIAPESQPDSGAARAELERRNASLEKVADQLRKRLAEAEANVEKLSTEPQPTDSGAARAEPGQLRQRLAEAEAKVEELTAERMRLRAELAAHKARQADGSAATAALEQRLREAEASARKPAGDRVQPCEELANQLADAADESAVLKQRNASLEATVGHLRRALSEAEASTQKPAGDRVQPREELAKQLADAAGASAVLKQRNTSLEATVGQLRQALSEAEHAAEKLAAENARSKADSAAREQLHAASSGACTELGKRNAALEAAAAELRRTLAEGERNLERLAAEKTHLSDRLAAAEDKLVASSAARAELETRNATTRGRLAAAQEQATERQLAGDRQRRDAEERHANMLASAEREAASLRQRLAESEKQAAEQTRLKDGLLASEKQLAGVCAGLRGSLAALEEGGGRLAAENGVLQEALAACKTHATDASEACVALERRNTDLEKAAGRLRESLGIFEDRNEKLAAENGVLQEALVTCKDHATEASEACVVLERRNTTLETAAEQLHAALAAAEERSEKLAVEKSVLKEALATCKHQAADAGDACAGLEEAADQLRRSLAAAEAGSERLADEKDRLKTALRACEERLADAGETAAKLEARAGDLQEKLAASRAAEEQSRREAADLQADLRRAESSLQQADRQRGQLEDALRVAEERGTRQETLAAAARAEAQQLHDEAADLRAHSERARSCGQRAERRAADLEDDLARREEAWEVGAAELRRKQGELTLELHQRRAAAEQAEASHLEASRLNSQKDDELRTTRDRERHTAVENAKLLRHVEDKARAESDLRRDLSALEARADEESSRAADLQRALADSAAALADAGRRLAAEKAAAAALRAGLELEHHGEVAELLRQAAGLREDVRSRDAATEDLRRELASTVAKQQAAVSQRDAEARRADGLQDELDRHAGEATEVHRQAAGLREDVRSRDATIEDLRRELASTVAKQQAAGEQRDAEARRADGLLDRHAGEATELHRQAAGLREDVRSRDAAIEDLRRELASTAAKQQAAGEQRDAEARRADGLQEELTRQRAAAAALADDRAVALRRAQAGDGEVSELHGRVDALEGLLRGREEELRHAVARSEQLGADLEATAEEAGCIAEQWAAHQARAAADAESLAAAAAQVRYLQTEVAERTAEAGELAQDKAGAGVRIADLSRQNAALTARVAVLEDERAGLATELDTLRGLRQATACENLELQSQVSAVGENRDALEKRLKHAEKLLRDAREGENRAEQGWETARADAEALRRAVRTGEIARLADGEAREREEAALRFEAVRRAAEARAEKAEREAVEAALRDQTAAVEDLSEQVRLAKAALEGAGGLADHPQWQQHPSFLRGLASDGGDSGLKTPGPRLPPSPAQTGGTASPPPPRGPPAAFALAAEAELARRVVDLQQDLARAGITAQHRALAAEFSASRLRGARDAQAREVDRVTAELQRTESSLDVCREHLRTEEQHHQALRQRLEGAEDALHTAKVTISSLSAAHAATGKALREEKERSAGLEGQVLALKALRGEGPSAFAEVYAEGKLEGDAARVDGLLAVVRELEMEVQAAKGARADERRKADGLRERETDLLQELASERARHTSGYTAGTGHQPQRRATHAPVNQEEGGAGYSRTKLPTLASPGDLDFLGREIPRTPPSRAAGEAKPPNDRAAYPYLRAGDAHPDAGGALVVWEEYRVSASDAEARAALAEAQGVCEELRHRLSMAARDNDSLALEVSIQSHRAQSSELALREAHKELDALQLAAPAPRSLNSIQTHRAQPSDLAVRSSRRELDGQQPPRLSRRGRPRASGEPSEPERSVRSCLAASHSVSPVRSQHRAPRSPVTAFVSTTRSSRSSVFPSPSSGRSPSRHSVDLT